MDTLYDLSDGKYKCKTKDIEGGAFSKIYDVELKKTNTKNKKNKYIAKVHTNKYKKEAVKEIETLLKLKRNKKKFKDNLKQFLDVNKKPELFKSKLAVIKDYYLDEDTACVIFKKYDIPLDDFNIKFNKMFKETLPPSLIKKIFNSLFLGLYELHFSKFIHCDIKPNNILLSLTKYNNIDELLKLVNSKKIKKDDMHKYIDIKIIDFNKTQKCKSIYKSINIQTLYYTPPEIVLGNRNYNYSVDVWAMMNVIYELMTSLFLFDVYNENAYNGPNYVNIDDGDNSELEDSSEVESDLSSTDSDDEDESVANLALLHLYNYQLGKNEMVTGEDVEKYYSCGQLMGTVNIEYTRRPIEDKINNKDIELKNKFLELYDKIYLYDIDNRISSEEIVRNYLF